MEIMKMAKVTFFLSILVFSMPVMAKDKISKELKKEKKRLTKEIQMSKAAKLNNPNYVASVGKFQK